MRATTSRNVRGGTVNPSTLDNGERVRATPTATAAPTEVASARLGLLRQKGLRRVRIAKITSVCVASDSMNQPVRKSDGPAWNTPSSTPKVRKSNNELSGPKKTMNL